MTQTLPLVFTTRLIAHGYHVHRTLKVFTRLSLPPHKDSFDVRIDTFPNRRPTRKEREQFSSIEKVHAIPWWMNDQLVTGIVDLIVRNPFDLDQPHTFFVNEQGNRATAHIVKFAKRA